MNKTTGTKLKTLRRWEVLDTRPDVATVYEVTLVEDEAGQRSIARVIRAPETRPQVIIISKDAVSSGKIPNEQMEQLAQDHIRYLEDHFCFCVEIRNDIQ